MAKAKDRTVTPKPMPVTSRPDNSWPSQTRELIQHGTISTGDMNINPGKPPMDTDK